MNPIRITLTPSAASATNIAASQSPGASALTLTTLAAGPIDPQTGTTYGLGRILVLTSGGNDSGITFTVTGIDHNGVVATEAIVGGNGGAVVSTKYYTSVSSITHTGSVTTTITVGTVGTTASAAYQVIPLDHHNGVGPIIQIDVTGTISYTVQTTWDDCITSSATPSSNVYFATPASPTALTAQSTSKYTQCAPGVNGVAVTIPTYSTGGSILVNIISPYNSERG